MYAVSIAAQKSSTPICRSRRRTCAVTAALLFAFSPLVWRYSIEAEVFAVNNFFCALILALAVRFYGAHAARDDARADASARWGALVCGLALTNQQTILIFIVVVCPSILLTWNPS